MTHDDRKFRPWYTPDTARWLRLSLAARGLIAELLRKWDDRGEIRAESAEDIAILLRLSLSEVEPALDECIRAGRLQWDGTAGVLRDPDFAARMRKTSKDWMREKRARDKSREGCEASDARDDSRITDSPREGSDDASPLLSSTLISSSGEREREREGSPQRLLDEDEPFTAKREAYVETVRMSTGESLDGPAMWRDFVNDRIEKSVLYGSHGAVDAAWRKWVDRQAKWAAEKRKNDREHKARMEKRYGDHTPKYEKPTGDQAGKFQAELARRLAEDAKKGAA
jgi:hypothetical protein